MSKRGLYIILIFGVVLFMSLASAAGNATIANSGDLVAKAYSCVTNKISTSTGLGLSDAIFGSLAIGSNTALDSVIASSKDSTRDCWPNSGCRVKESAQVALAWSREGKPTADIKTFLNGQIDIATGIDWFLQIDITSRDKSTCSIKVGDEEKAITINTDQTISGNPGTCFVLGGNQGFWLKVKTNCYDKDISISCDRDFVTSTLYERTNGDVVFLTGNTHSSAASGTTSEKVTSNCFLTNAKCDYEGTLWASVAYKQMGNDISGFMPYLLALSDDNEKYFPETFLYMATGSEGYYTKIVQSQINNQYWQLTTPDLKFYHTALAMMALSTSSAAELDNAKNYLLGILGGDGCWANANVRDSAFLLYAGWPKTVGGAASSCDGAGYSCEIPTACTDAGGQEKVGYECAGLLKCCSVIVPKKSCTSQNGNLCGISQDCTGATAPSAEGTCCLGTCVAKTTLNVCETYGGTCRDSCGSGETESPESCPDASQVCCMASSGGISWIMIILLLILIALVVLGIIYRNKLRPYWLILKGRLSTIPIFRGRGAPAGAVQRGPPRYPPSGYARPAARGTSSDMEETLRKLRELAR